MTKCKKKSKQQHQSAAVHSEAGNAVRSDSVVISHLGVHCHSAVLVPKSTALLQGSEGRLGLPADAFLSAGISSGQIVAIALSNRPVRGEEELPGLTSQAGAPPASSPQPCPANLWKVYECHGLAASTSNSEDEPHPGDYLLLATAWPAKLPKGKAALSAGLLSSFGGEKCVGESVLVYKLPPECKRSPDVDIHLSLLSPETTKETEFDGPGTRPPRASSSLPSATEWLSRLLQKGKPRQLLERSAAWHLKGRLLLSGNPVALPVIGKDCLFKAHLQAGNAEWTFVVVEGGSKVQLGGEAAGREENQPGFQDAAERAAEAAAEAVGGGREGPAAQAAFRAAESGAVALQGDGLGALGGLGTQIDALKQLVCLPLQDPGLFARYGVQPPRGVLLWGPPGTGKTRLAAAMAAAAGAAFFVINGPDIVSAFYGHSEQGLRGVFAAARAAAPSIVFIDELDALAPAREGKGAPSRAPQVQLADSGASARTVTTLLTEMQQVVPSASCVVIAATNRPEALDSALRRPGRFDRELEVGVPSPADRADILRVCLLRIKHALSANDIQSLAAAAHGYVGADLAALCEEAALAALRRAISASFQGKLQVSLEDFRSAETRVRPSAMREIALEVPNVGWGDVGGLEEVKQRLKEAVQWPQQHADALRRIGAKAPAGVLLFGPPGCSKTLLARAVAAEAGLNFLAVKGSELFSKYVGDSERAIAALFARARTAAPAIVFFDELDGLAGRRGDGSESGSEVGNRVVAQILTEMDGVQRRAGVVVLAATNRPDRIDAALLRPGRFDRLLFVPPPDESARAAIVRVHMRGTPLATDVDVDRIASTTAGYTGADISALVREASLAALEEDLEATNVAARHFAAAQKVVKGSVRLTEEEVEMYRAFCR